MTHVIGAVIAGYAFASMACFFLLDFYWFESAPYQPSYDLGLIYPHMEHGTVKYLSAYQVTCGSLLIGSPLPLAMIAYLLLPRPNMRNWPSWYTPSLTNPEEDPKGRLKWWILAAIVATPMLLFGLGAPFVHALNEAGLVLYVRSG